MTPVCEKCHNEKSYDKEQDCYRCLPCAFGNTAHLKFSAAASAYEAMNEEQATAKETTTPARAYGEVPLSQLEDEFQKRKYLGRKITLANCSSCGAQVEATAADFVSTCLYCGKKTTLSEDTQLSSQYQAVVPFKIDARKATQEIQKFIKSKKFGSLVKASSVKQEDVRKLYVPFWCFDVEVLTSWNGDTGRQLDPTFFQKLTGQDGTWQEMKMSGDREGAYNDLLVCGSQSIPNELVRALEPFSTEGAEWGSGLDDPSLIVERVAQSPRVAWKRARKEVRAREYDVCTGMADNQALIYKSQLPRIGGTVDFRTVAGKAALLPIYLFTRDTRKGLCRVVVNGETGKVNGKVPEPFDRTMILMAAGFILSMIGNKYVTGLFDRHFGQQALEDEMLELEEMIEEKSKMLQTSGQ